MVHIVQRALRAPRRRARRPRAEAAVRNALDAAPRTMQPPHVEFGLGPHRPRVASFFCEVPPAADGETALFSFPRALERLDPELRRLLHTHGWWTSRRHRAARDAAPPGNGARGAATLRLQPWPDGALPRRVSAGARRRAARPPARRPDCLLGAGQRGTDAGDGRRAQGAAGERGTVQLYRAMFGATRLHTWRQGDVLLFDNVLFGHARMPGQLPRLLHAIAEEMDTRAAPRHGARVRPRRRRAQEQGRGGHHALAARPGRLVDHPRDRDALPGLVLPDLRAAAVGGQHERQPQADTQSRLRPLGSVKCSDHDPRERNGPAFFRLPGSRRPSDTSCSSPPRPRRGA